jgi:hypothetical protein
VTAIQVCALALLVAGGRALGLAADEVATLLGRVTARLRPRLPLWRGVARRLHRGRHRGPHRARHRVRRGYPAGVPNVVIPAPVLDGPTVPGFRFHVPAAGRRWAR